MVKIVGLLAVMSVLFSCAHVEQKLIPDKFYKRDMKLKVNGYQGDGTLVLPKSEIYAMEISTGQPMDLFTLQSCHREWVATVETSGWFGTKRKQIKYDYKPISDLETKGSCGLELGGYDKDKGKHSWAFIDFETDEEKLPALIKCNGSEANTNGVSACQSRIGLWQEISFTVDVMVSPDKDCDAFEEKSGKVFKYRTKKELCVYAFMEKAQPHRLHRLTTLGYEDIVIRGEQ